MATCELPEEFSPVDLRAFIRNALESLQVDDSDATLLLHEAYDPYSLERAGAVSQDFAYTIEIVDRTDPVIGVQPCNGAPGVEGAIYDLTIGCLRRRVGDPISERDEAWALSEKIRKRLNDRYWARDQIPPGVTWNRIGRDAPRTPQGNVERIDLRWEVRAILHQV